jgi:Xaa-Pro aminopeptidase
MPDVPFELSEYRDRARRVREEMARRDIDVLFVTSAPNTNYLSGFESIWYPPRAPVGVVVTRDGDDLVFCDYERHQNHVSTLAHFDDAIFYSYTTAVDTIANEFQRRGWCDGTIGVEYWSINPGPPLLREVADALAARGGNVVAGDWVVNRVRAVKSPAELERVRRASQIADEAFLQVLDEIRPGMTELQVSARVDLAMAERGGEPPAIRTMISAGPEVWCRTHGAPGRRPVERGDIMYFDTSGVVDRYHVDLCRTISVGTDHDEVRGILDVTRGSVDAVIAAVKPGDPLDVAQKVAEDYVFSRFDRDTVWWVGGYALGIALPPDWVGHTYLSNDAFEQFTWEPGYVTNYENILYSRDRHFTASYMETLLMTERGIEVLSTVPRTLHVAPCGS